MSLLKLLMLLQELGEALLLSYDLGLMPTDFFIGLHLLSFNLLFDLLHMFGRYPTLVIKKVVIDQCDG